MADILDLFDCETKGDEKELLKQIRRDERREKREADRQAGLELAEYRAKMLAPAPEMLVGIELIVQLQECDRCHEQTEHVISNGVMLKYYQPAKVLPVWGNQKNYLVNAESTHWRSGPLPLNWQSLPRDIKYIESSTPVCAECWERAGIIGLDDDCADIEVHLEECQHAS